MYSFFVHFSATFHYKVSPCPGAAKHLLMYLKIVLVVSINGYTTLEHFANSLLIRAALSVSPPWSTMCFTSISPSGVHSRGSWTKPSGLAPKNPWDALTVNPLFFHSYLMTIFLHLSNVFIDDLWIFIKAFLHKISLEWLLVM